eukprot:CAMPEP_0115253242 /NCGR_PEP_ID=MMETSP0270-20121206/44568_1 /TAXON_ID=71861 /ORGANISM="Scrippsiella trochoidea, Strain CCMP3099" /LENGTH=158 /DNA_ID=CAMNT_0002668735 /DNA_START=76 /DNA_END=552 /DNA_ORIENTATION=-
MESIALQDCHLTSVFGQGTERHFEKQFSSSNVGRGGAFQPTASIRQEHTSHRDAVCLREVAQAMAEEDLDKLRSLWEARLGRGLPGLPLDNRALNEIRRKAASIARSKLRESLQSDDIAAISQAIRFAGQAEDLFPHAQGVRSSLEFKAASARAQQGE